MLRQFFCGTTVDSPNEVTFFSQQERELPGLPGGMRGLTRVIGGWVNLKKQVNIYQNIRE